MLFTNILTCFDVSLSCILGVAAAADGLRYIGHLLAFLIGLYIVITMIVHWGGKIIRWVRQFLFKASNNASKVGILIGLCFAPLQVFIFEFIAFLGQFFAWMLDANSARLIKGATYHYKLAIASTIIGLFLSFMTLYLTLALFFGRDEMAELVDDDDAVPSAA